MTIDRDELDFMINESHQRLTENREAGIYTPAFNQDMGWHDCLLYIKEEYFGL